MHCVNSVRALKNCQSRKDSQSGHYIHCMDRKATWVNMALNLKIEANLSSVALRCCVIKLRKNQNNIKSITREH